MSGKVKFTESQARAILKDAEEVGLAYEPKPLTMSDKAYITLAIAAVAVLVFVYSDEIVRRIG